MDVLQDAYYERTKSNKQQKQQQQHDPQRPPPVLINVGRGDLITTRTIIDSLSSKLLSGVIIDVAEEEPLPSSDPLWTTPNVIISPHVSALTRGKDVPKVITEQYRRYVQSQKDGGDLRKDLQYVVDWDKGY
jgi:phosphoglycerate dehydrogenase-like enzyme